MHNKTEIGKKEQNPRLTTFQVSAIAHITGQALYYYVRDFKQFFSPGVTQVGSGPPGRSWSQGDLELVFTIRALRQQKLGTAKITEILASGYHLESLSAWARELHSQLISEIISAYADAKRATQEVISLKSLLEEHKRDSQAFQALWIRQGDLEHEFEMLEKAWRLKTTIKKALVKKYHGQPPELYPPIG